MGKRTAAMLRELRLKKRLTQTELANGMGVSQSYYSSIERGEKPREVIEAMKAVSSMRSHTDRTDGGAKKAGRLKY